MITKIAMREIIEKYGVKIHTKTKLLEISNEYCLVEQWENKESIPFDLSFVCLGMKERSGLIDDLSSLALENNMEVINIGDSKRARRIMEGTREARDIVEFIKQKIQLIS